MSSGSGNRALLKIQTPPHSLEQRMIMNAFFTPGLLEMWVACGTKFGKACHVDEDIPTPRGWRKFGDLKAGDFVFDEKGKSTRVLYATEIMYGHKCYEVVFSDGQKIIADAGHLWTTTTHRTRKNMARAINPKDRCKSTTAKPETLTTIEILETLYVPINGRYRPNHAIDNCRPLSYSEKTLLIPPYVLGVWLGDGTSSGGQVSSADQQIAEEIKKEGYDCEFSKRSPQTINTRGLMKHLRMLGVLENKHVPKRYLLGSYEQRLALLQGLMDTDGTISKLGACCFDNTNKNLADAVDELAVSLGIKTMRAERLGKLNGKAYKLCYRVQFTTDLPVFRLERKLARIRKAADKSKRRYIVAINPVDSVPVRCISVKNPSHLFLIGRGCIPTHNSWGISVALCLASFLTRQALWRWIAPIYSQSKIGYKYCKRILPTDKNHVLHNESGPGITFPKMDTQLQFFHGQNPESLEGEATAGNVLDEAAKMKEAVYDSVKTTTTVTQGPIVGVSTPRGKNWFYKKCMEAKEEMARARIEKRRPRKIYIHAPTWANPSVSQTVIDDARKTLPRRVYEMYYEALFHDDGSIFLYVADAFGGGIYLDEFSREPTMYLNTHNSKKIFVGADWAKTHDYTVFFAINDQGKMVGYKRFNRVGYVEQVGMLRSFCDHVNRTSTHDDCYLSALHDKTGVGEAVDDIISTSEFPYDISGIEWNNYNKERAVNDLMLSLEERCLSLLRIEQLRSEFTTFEVSTTPSGRPKYGAIEGEFDDCIMSLVLANMLYREGRNMVTMVGTVDAIRNTVTALYYDGNQFWED